MIYETTGVRRSFYVKRVLETDIIVVVLEPLRHQSPSVTVVAKTQDDSMPVLQLNPGEWENGKVKECRHNLQRHLLGEQMESLLGDIEILR